MAYELHIERLPVNDEGEPTPIPLEDWKAAIAATQGVRLFTADAHTITNPATGEVISIAKRDGDAEVYFPEVGKWISAFRWFEGSAKFNARFMSGKLHDPVWMAAAALASHLDAVIRGDEGERYDLKTAEVIEA